MTNIFKILWAKFLSWSVVERDSEKLSPGVCQCGHNRCIHADGKRRCAGWWEPDETIDEWTKCSCQIYIEDDDDNDEEDIDPTPSPEELEELYRK